MRSKYGNKKAKAGDLVFDSRKERDRYLKLSLLMKAGEISDLRRQVSYELIPAIYETVEKQMKTKTKMVRRCAQRAVHYVDVQIIDPRIFKLSDRFSEICEIGTHK